MAAGDQVAAPGSVLHAAERLLLGDGAAAAPQHPAGPPLAWVARCLIVVVLQEWWADDSSRLGWHSQAHIIPRLHVDRTTSMRH